MDTKTDYYENGSWVQLKSQNAHWPLQRQMTDTAIRNRCNKGPCTYDVCKTFIFTPLPPVCIFMQPSFPRFLTASDFGVPPTPSLCRHHMYMPPNGMTMSSAYANTFFVGGLSGVWFSAFVLTPSKEDWKSAALLLLLLATMDNHYWWSTLRRCFLLCNTGLFNNLCQMLLQLNLT